MLIPDRIKLEKDPNYMTVSAAIHEMEKIEMARQTDGRYRMDHAVTVTQKAILKAFEMDADYVRRKASELSRELADYAGKGSWDMSAMLPGYCS